MFAAYLLIVKYRHNNLLNSLSLVNTGQENGGLHSQKEEMANPSQHQLFTILM